MGYEGAGGKVQNLWSYPDIDAVVCVFFAIRESWAIICFSLVHMVLCNSNYYISRHKRFVERKRLGSFSVSDVVLSDCTVNLTSHPLQTMKHTAIPPKK